MIQINEVIQIDFQMNNKETLTAIKELVQGLENLNFMAGEISGAILQISHSMQNSESSISLMKQGSTTLANAFGVLDLKFMDIAKKNEKWNDVAQISSKMLNTLMNCIKTTTASLTVKTIATTLATGATKLLTIAMNALPIFAVMAGIQLLIGAIQAAVGWLTNWFKSTKDVSESTERLDADLERLQDSVSKTREATAESSRAFDDNMKAIDKNSESIQHQMSQLQQLAGQEELSAFEKGQLKPQTLIN